METIRRKGVNMKWFGVEVNNAVKKVLRNVNKETAEKLMADAKALLRQKATTTTERGLLDQFSIAPSKYSDTDFLVWVQGPQLWRPPYHASFLEMGTYKDAAKPFLRPTMHRYKRKARSMMMKALDKELKTRSGSELWR